LSGFAGATRHEFLTPLDQLLLWSSKMRSGCAGAFLLRLLVRPSLLHCASLSPFGLIAAQHSPIHTAGGVHLVPGNPHRKRSPFARIHAPRRLANSSCISTFGPLGRTTYWILQFFMPILWVSNREVGASGGKLNIVSGNRKSYSTGNIQFLEAVRGITFSM
jgi:hypothetical protein